MKINCFIKFVKLKFESTWAWTFIWFLDIRFSSIFKLRRINIYVFLWTCWGLYQTSKILQNLNLVNFLKSIFFLLVCVLVLFFFFFLWKIQLTRNRQNSWIYNNLLKYPLRKNKKCNINFSNGNTKIHDLKKIKKNTKIFLSHILLKIGWKENIKNTWIW